MLPDGYIKRTTSTIPFGYELSSINGYLKPIPEQLKNLKEQLKNLKEVSQMVVDEQISLGVAVDWLEETTNRKMSRMGLKKYIDKNYGTRQERLGS